MFAFKGQKKINLKILFKNTFKIATFFAFENFFTNGFTKDLRYAKITLSSLRLFVLLLLHYTLQNFIISILFFLINTVYYMKKAADCFFSTFYHFKIDQIQVLKILKFIMTILEHTFILNEKN
jgi:hypothetical protein